MNVKELTQDQVNEMFEEVKQEWNRMVSESGKTESMFIIIGNSSEFLMNYQMAKEYVESLGLHMPELVKGLEIKID